MILIDALYINAGGGKILLDYLVSELEARNSQVYYLLDKRIEGEYSFIEDDRKVFLKASVINRLSFYNKTRGVFGIIFCFGNLPPYSRQDVKTYTYFHQPLFLKLPDTLKLKTRGLIFLKTVILDMIKGNTDNFFVQSSYIRDALINKYGVEPEEVCVLPFYPPIGIDTCQSSKEKFSFLYISNGSPHKNQNRLIDAFTRFYKKHKKGKLTLTINSDHPELLSKIAALKNENIPIYNLGFVEREKLASHYKKSEFIIFPSLAESFGLGLIEGIEMGCKILGADLPYTYEVCRPSYVFNPHHVDEIEKAFTVAVHENLPPSEPLIKNKIEEIITLLTSENKTYD